MLLGESVSVSGAAVPVRGFLKNFPRSLRVTPQVSAALVDERRRDAGSCARDRE
jgi:hypothetical protein